MDSLAKTAWRKLTNCSLRVGVIGDVMLDRFLYGDVDRISPEAPVPVVVVDRILARLGGAANVANNIKTLGATVDLLGVVGDDGPAEELAAELEGKGISPEGLVVSRDRPTAVKTRIIARHQQVVRFDLERPGELPEAPRSALMRRVDDLAPKWDGMILSDYGKGVVNQQIVSQLTNWATKTGAWIVVDPKPVNAPIYRGTHAMTPNTKEAETMTGFRIKDEDDAERAGNKLLASLGLRAVVLTRGEQGMSVVEPDRVTHLPARARDVFDVTGAGDTAIALFTLAVAAGANVAQAAALANLAAGIVVGKLGTAVVQPEEIESEIAGSETSATGVGPNSIDNDDASRTIL